VKTDVPFSSQCGGSEREKLPLFEGPDRVSSQEGHGRLIHCLKERKKVLPKD
jgi:hypothetical protein